MYKMDSEYRRALKAHFKKSFTENQNKSKTENLTIGFVEPLLPTKGLKIPHLSRTVDALLDGSYTSDLLLSKRHQIGDLDSLKSRGSERTGHLNYSSTIYSIVDNRRENGGQDIASREQFVGSTQTLISRASSNRTSSTTFRPRTSRDLLGMVRSQCRVAQRHFPVSESSVSQILHPPKVLWKSRRKFSSTEEVRSMATLTSGSSVSNLRLMKEKKAPVRIATPSRHNSEKIVRDQFTAPLTREVERIYLQNILTTADLLKKLDNMPSAIVDALDKLQH